MMFGRKDEFQKREEAQLAEAQKELVRGLSDVRLIMAVLVELNEALWCIDGPALEEAGRRITEGE